MMHNDAQPPAQATPADTGHTPHPADAPPPVQSAQSADPGAIAAPREGGRDAGPIFPPQDFDDDVPDDGDDAIADGDAPADGKPSRVDKAAGGKPDTPTPPVEKKRERKVDWGKLNELVANFALIYGTDQVWDARERTMMKISAMGHAHGGDLVKLWKASEKRRTVRQADVVFDPTGQADPVRQINLFDGFPLVPQEGSVGPILDLARFLTSRASDHDDECDQIMHWLLCWLAYPLQHPGAKLRTAVIVHGDEGAGKNFLMDTVVAIYGRYGTTVGQDELEDKFNDWRSAKLFVVGDEVSSRQELVHNKNRLKALITSPTVQINPKNMARREEANHINVVFLSNEQMPLALDNSDRRYLVLYTPRAKDPEYYRALAEWRAEGGLAAFYHFLLHYDTSDFSPYAPAPATQAKADLIALNRKSPEQFWWEWAQGELDLPYASCTVAQAYRAYIKWCQRTGERFPVRQGLFSPMVCRMAESNSRPAKVKVMKLAAEGEEEGKKPRMADKKAERMLLVTEPPDLPNDAFTSAGAWASWCRDEFESALRRYTGFYPNSKNTGESNDD